MKLFNILNMMGLAIQNLRDPVNPQDAATKAYADALAQGFKWKEPVRAATTANVTLSGLQTIDGVSLVAADRVLVKNQSAPSANGIYVVASGAWTRATDFDQNSEVLGATVFVSEGSTLGNAQFVMTTDGPITLGTTGLTFIQNNGGMSYTPGVGIKFNGAEIAIDPTVVSRKVAFTIGDGTATAYNLNHNLNTTDVAVTLQEVSSKSMCMTDWNVVDANNVQIVFAAAATNGQFRAFVQG